MRPVLAVLAVLAALAPAPAAAQSPAPGAPAPQGSPAPPPRSDQALVNQLAQVMRPAGAASGAVVRDLDAGREVFGWRPTAKRVPASVQKLFTTSAALRRYGSSERLATIVVGTGLADGAGAYRGDLFLKGGGDPTLGASDVADLARQVRARGVVRLEGRVLGDESAFDALRGVPDSGLGRISPYVGPLGALLYNRGLAVGGGYQTNPPAYAAERLRAALAAAGVRVTGSAGAQPAPPAAAEVARDTSPSMSELVTRTNRPSDNHVAEVLLKGLGARFGGQGSTGAGARVVRRAAGELGSQARVADGSGLSRRNLVAPREVVDLLQGMDGDAAFRASLPVAGRSGTLASRMRGSAARDRCQAKTGTLRDASALAGYCHSRSGRRFAFAALMNGVSPAAARARQDRLAALLAGQ